MFSTLVRHIKGEDLLEEIWRERDETDIEALREKVQRLRIQENTQERAALTLKAAGLDQQAQQEQEKAERLRTERSRLTKRISRIEERVKRMDVAMRARDWPHV